jgi:hypothetical protein
MSVNVLPDHAVLPGEDSRSYRSVRIRPISRAKRLELGRKLRDEIPRASLGKWRVDRHRPDPIAQIAGYVGSSDRLDTAMTRFARAYADQIEADHERLVRAVRRGARLVENQAPSRKNASRSALI